MGKDTLKGRYHQLDIVEQLWNAIDRINDGLEPHELCQDLFKHAIDRIEILEGDIRLMDRELEELREMALGGLD